jgi:hypothetical protein
LFEIKIPAVYVKGRAEEFKESKSHEEARAFERA